MTKFRIDLGGNWSGGGGVVLANARFAAQQFPKFFGTEESAIPILFRNVVPTKLLASGKFIYMPQNAWPWAGITEGISEKLRRVYLRLQSQVALSRALGTMRAGPNIPEHRNAHSQILTNMLDVDFEDANQSALTRCDFGEGFFFCVGSCWGYRNLPCLLRGFEAYRRQGGTRKLVIASSGPRMSTVRQLAGDGVEIHEAKLSRSELITIFRLSQAVIFPSTVEASPLTILEAAASGSRIVMSNIPGHVVALDSIDGKHQLSFNALDPGALCSCLRQVDEPSVPPVTSKLDTAEGRSETRQQWCKRLTIMLQELVG